jgi:hypothetical protein
LGSSFSRWADSRIFALFPIFRHEAPLWFLCDPDHLFFQIQIRARDVLHLGATVFIPLDVIRAFAMKLRAACGQNGESTIPASLRSRVIWIAVWTPEKYNKTKYWRREWDSNPR